MLSWLISSGVVISLVLSSIGLVKRKVVLVALGALFLLLFVWYLDGTPRFNGYALILPLFHFGAAIALKKGKIRLAWILLMPVIAFIIWIIFIL
jgi:hypothetical protein